MNSVQRQTVDCCDFKIHQRGWLLFVCCLISENAVIPKNKEGTENEAVKIDHENSTESSEDLKRKIEDLQNASLQTHNLIWPGLL